MCIPSRGRQTLGGEFWFRLPVLARSDYLKGYSQAPEKLNSLLKLHQLSLSECKDVIWGELPSTPFTAQALKGARPTVGLSLIA